MEIKIISNEIIKPKVKIIKCMFREYEGKIVEVFRRYANGIDFIGKYGAIFVNNGNYEVI